MGFTVKKVLRRVLRRGSEKAASRRCLERPLVEYAPLGVRPMNLYSVAGLPEFFFFFFAVQLPLRGPAERMKEVLVRGA